MQLHQKGVAAFFTMILWVLSNFEHSLLKNIILERSSGHDLKIGVFNVSAI